MVYRTAPARAANPNVEVSQPVFHLASRLCKVPGVAEKLLCHVKLHAGYLPERKLTIIVEALRIIAAPVLQLELLDTQSRPGDIQEARKASKPGTSLPVGLLLRIEDERRSVTNKRNLNEISRHEDLTQ